MPSSADVPFPNVKISTTTPCGSVLRGHYSVKGTPKQGLGPRERIGIGPLCSVTIFGESFFVGPVEHSCKM